MKLLLILLTFLTFPAWAILTPDNKFADEMNLPQTCKLNFYVMKDGKALKGICTGTYIGNGTFSSAEHCHDDVANNLGYKIPEQAPSVPWFECPTVNKKFPIASSHPFRTTGKIHHQDLALMKVSVEIPETELTPMATPDSEEHSGKLLKDPARCFISGYGLTNRIEASEDKSKVVELDPAKFTYGKLQTAQLKDLDPKPFTYGENLSPFGLKLYKSYAQPGDSGGPLFCMDGDKPVLIAVTHGSYAGLPYSSSERISQSLDWLKYVKAAKNPDNDVFKTFFRTEDICTTVENCLGKLHTAATLSKDVQKIVQELTKARQWREEVEATRKSMFSGQDVDIKKLDRTWQQIADEWSKYKCFEVLNPPKK